MSEIISKTESEISKLNSTPGGTHLRTGEIRKLSSRLFGELEDKSRENVFRVCEEFLEKQSWPMRVIAFDFAYRIRKQYGENTFRVLKNGLLNMSEDGETVMISAPMPLVNLLCRIQAL